MGKQKTSMLQDALDAVEKLPSEDQQTLVGLIRRRLVERRREEIARNAAENLELVRKGRARHGSIEDLKRDILAKG